MKKFKNSKRRNPRLDTDQWYIIVIDGIPFITKIIKVENNKIFVTGFRFGVSKYIKSIVTGKKSTEFGDINIRESYIPINIIEDIEGPFNSNQEAAENLKYFVIPEFILQRKLIKAALDKGKK